MSKHQSSVAKTRKRKRLQKAKREARPFLALLSAAVTLAMATLVGASSSPQVEQLSPLAVARTGHVATALSDGRILITGGRDSSGTVLSAAEIFDPATQKSTAIASLGSPTFQPDSLYWAGTGAAGRW